MLGFLKKAFRIASFGFGAQYVSGNQFHCRPAHTGMPAALRISGTGNRDGKADADPYDQDTTF